MTAEEVYERILRAHRAVTEPNATDDAHTVVEMHKIVVEYMRASRAFWLHVGDPNHRAMQGRLQAAEEALFTIAGANGGPAT